MKYKIKCPIEILDSPNSNDFAITVVGEGGDGELELSPKNYNFGIIKVNFVKNGKFQLVNNSNITFNIRIDLELEGNYSEKNRKFYKNFFKLDFKKGIIPAKSKKEINIIF